MPTNRVSKEINTLEGHIDLVRAVAFSPDGRTIVSGSEDSTLRLWDVGTHQGFAILKGHTRTVRSVVFSPDGRLIASASYDKTLRLWDVETHRCLAILEGHTGSVWAVTFSPDGHLMASVSGDQTVRLWDVETHQCVATLEGHANYVYSVAFSPDGRTIVSGSADNTLRIWDVDTYQCLATLRGHLSFVLSVAFSPDSQTIVSGSEDRTLRIWDVETHQCFVALEGHTGSIRSVAFRPDGQTIVSGADDHTVRLWSMNEGRCLDSLEGHTDCVYAVSFSPDGQTIVSGSFDHTLRLWSVTLPGLPEANVVGEDSTSYVNVKALIVGDTGVGKTGLATWLTTGRCVATSPTVGVWATVMPLISTSSEGNSASVATSREVWLWDFGGQSDYRLIHQLFMTDAALVILVFDAQRPDFWESINRWESDIALATGGNKPKLLVLGRHGLGGLSCSRSDIEDFCKEKDFRGYFETDAHTDFGCQDLCNAIIENVDWGNQSRTSSPRIFKRLKEEILKLRDEGKVLLSRNELLLLIEKRMWREDFAPEQFDAVLHLLSGPGVIWRLAFGDFILLRPEWINRYAWAMIRSIRAHPDEMGYVAEDALTSGDLLYGTDERLPPSDERYVLIALHQTLIERALCLREKTSSGNVLVFPSLYRRDRPDAPDTHPALATYRFTGFLEDIYASLVVRLHHTEAFSKTALWRNAADFQTLTKQRIGIKLERLAEGRGEITLYADPSIPTDTQVNFELYANHHIRSKATNVQRTRHYTCPKCGTAELNYPLVEKRLKRGDKDIRCGDCGELYLLWDAIEERFASPEAREQVSDMVKQTDTMLKIEGEERALVGDVIKIITLANQRFEGIRVGDRGVNGKIIFRNARGNETGAQVYVQLKSGNSYLRRRSSDNAEVFALPDPEHIAYWQSLPHDVYLVIRQSNGDLQWMNLSAYLKDQNTHPREVIFKGKECNHTNLLALRNTLVGFDEDATIKFVEGLVTADLDRLLTRLPNASDYVPDGGAKLSRVSALITYIRSATGPGMAHLAAVLEVIFQESFKPS